MQQPVPKVNRDDVLRIVRRDFPAAEQDRVLAMLQNEYHYPEPARVQLAILKIVNGNIAALPSEIERAKFDFRDVLVIAEYPTDWKERGFQTNVPTDKQRQIYEEDWKQYNTWLNK